jgi:multidrug efflux system membrane fusion protein
MSSHARNTFDIVGKRARNYDGGATRWGERNLPGGAATLWIGVGLLAVALVLWAVWPSSQLGSRRFGIGIAQPVGVSPVEVGDIHVTVNALGTVTPLATVTVRPQVSGQILKIDFVEGQTVKAGDVLAEIDPRTFQDALDQAKGQLARDSAALANAKVDLGRFQGLNAQNAISKQQLDTQATLVRQDTGVVQADNATVKAAAVNMGYTRITAPVAGRAGLRQVDVGNLVEAGQTAGVVVITQLQPISVLFTLPEDDIGSVMQQVNAGTTLTADAWDRGQTHKLATGRLAAVDSQIDTTTGTVKLRAMFDNSDGALFPNQFVNVRLLVSTLHDQISVPGAAVQRGAEGMFVFAVNSDSTVSMRQVSLGPADGDRVAVVQGVKPGDVVVVDGADRLRDGSKVTLPSGQRGNGSAGVASGSFGNTTTADNSRTSRRALFMKILPKLTPEEREQLRGMNRSDRSAWINAHYQELMKRKDQPGAEGGFFGGGGGGTP